MNSKKVRNIGIILIVIWFLMDIVLSVTTFEMFKGDKGFIPFIDDSGNTLELNSSLDVILMTLQDPSLSTVLLIIGIVLLLVSVKMKQ